MIFRRLAVRNVAGLVPGAVIEEFGPELTVLHGPNEAGKSTLVRSLGAALFQRHGVSGADAERVLRSVGRAITPEVVVEFDTGGETYRLTKRFLSSASAELARRESGVFAGVAEGNDADERVRALLGSSFAGRGWTKGDRRGLGQLLLAEQGAVVIEELGGDARDHLASAIGQVAQTSEARGLAARVASRFEGCFTTTGKLRRGASAPPVVALKTERTEWSDKLAAAQHELVEAEGHVRDVASAAGRQATRQQGIDEAVKKRDEVRKQRDRAAELDIEIERCAREHETAARDAEIARRVVAELMRVRGELTTCETEGESAARTVTETETKASAARGDVSSANASAQGLAARRERVAAQVQEARDARRLHELTRSIDDRQRRLAEHDELVASAKELATERDARARPERRELDAVRALNAERDRLDAELARRQLRVRVRAERDVELRSADQTHSLAAGQEHELSADGALSLDLVGIAGVEIVGPHVGGDRAELATERDATLGKLAAATAPYGTTDLEALAALVQERDDLDRRISENDARQRGLFRDDAAVADARRIAARERGERDGVLARHDAWADGGAPAAAAAPDFERAADAASEELRVAEAASGDRVRSAQEVERVCGEALAKAREETARLTQQRGALRADLQRLERDLEASDDAERARIAEERAAAAGTLATTLKTLRTERDALGENPASLFAAAERAVEQLREQDRNARAADVRSETLLEQLMESAPYAQVARAEEAIARLDARIVRENATLEGLRLLHDTFETERKQAVDVVLSPVRQKMERMARALVGERLGVELGESYLPEAHPLAGVEGALAPDQLSYGTRDQFALLLRLAYAETVARGSGERQALVLDDPLVHVDAGRRMILLDILGRATKDLQVIVMTCHPEQYAGAPEGTVWVEMDAAKRAAAQ